MLIFMPPFDDAIRRCDILLLIFHDIFIISLRFHVTLRFSLAFAYAIAMLLPFSMFFD